MWATFLEISSVYWILGLVYVIGMVVQLIETRVFTAESEVPQSA